ncbi:signal peptidase I [Rickettsiales bacterium LUAb2]
MKILNIFFKKSVNKKVKEKTKKKKLIDNILALVIAFIIAIIFRSFLYQSSLIPSGSMEPNLLIGDYLFVNKYSYGYSKYSVPLGDSFLGNARIFYKEPKRGDVVVFKYPGDTSIEYIKRVIGLPGDKIQVIGGVLYINNKPIVDKKLYTEERDNVSYTVLEETLPNGKKFKVYKDYTVINPANNTDPFYIEKGHFFMMGDNRDYSRDSRFPDVGQVPEVNLVGKADVIFFSIDGRFLEFWKWNKIRFERIFQLIN